MGAEEEKMSGVEEDGEERGGEVNDGEMSQFYKTYTDGVYVCICPRTGLCVRVLEVSHWAINRCHYPALFPHLSVTFSKWLHSKCQTSARSERHRHNEREKNKDW